MTIPLKAATYSRCSTSDKGQNPEIQSQELKRYCQARGWDIRQEIVDHGYSGGTDQRPGLKTLLSLVRRREVDVVVVVKLDRLFRSLRHLVVTLDEFQALGVQFCATADAIDFTTPAGRLLAQILGSLAEFERSLVRERTILGLDHARRSGKKLGRPKTANDGAIRELRSKGFSYTQIQRAINVSKGAVSRALSTTPKSYPNQSSKSPKKSGVGHE